MEAEAERRGISVGQFVREAVRGALGKLGGEVVGVIEEKRVSGGRTEGLTGIKFPKGGPAPKMVGIKPGPRESATGHYPDEPAEEEYSQERRGRRG